MREVLVLGAGKIGGLIACLLAGSGDYVVHLADVDPAAPKRHPLPAGKVRTVILDAQDPSAVAAYAASNRVEALISSLPYHCNPQVARVARDHEAHYFDLTEDIAVTDEVRSIARGAPRAFVPQCGLAPGFISIAAGALMAHFDAVTTVKMRVGALPVNPNNALKYSLTWSTDGLINEYGNVCHGIEDGRKIALLPLEGYETITLDGVLYEAFNTSGGLGTLADTHAGRVRTMNYKTLRYPGHRDLIHFLMNELELNDDRATLKRILERAVPQTLQDVVLIYVAVTGRRGGELFEETYAKKVYPQTIAGEWWSAIQVTTAAGLSSIVDLVLDHPDDYRGLVTQERFLLADVLANRFGAHYR
jgi:saccharopine dehydrogenase-like NADP-dependent oxidoreductase